MQTAQGINPDVRLLSISGVQSESDVPNAGLLSLLRPVLFLLPRLTTVGGATLRQALGLENDAPPSQFGVAGATLELLAAASAEQPTIITIDDAQWIDAQSMFCLMFALRRLDGDSIGALFSFLAGHAVPAALHDLPHMSSQVWAWRRPTLSCRGMATRLPRFVAELHTYTGGNPLALHEISRTLTACERAGLRPVGTRTTFSQTSVGVLAASWRTSTSTRASPYIFRARLHGTPRRFAQRLSHVDCPAGALDSDRLSQFLFRTPESVAFRHPLIRAAAQGERSQRRRPIWRSRTDWQCTGRGFLRAWHLSEASPDQNATIALRALRGRD